MSPRQPQHITRQNLLDAAVALFAEKGIATTTTAEVSKRAGVATGTLFNHFATKIELTEAVYLHLKAVLVEQIQDRIVHDGGPYELLRSLWHAFVVWSLDHPQEHAVMARLKTYVGLSETTRQQGEQVFAFALDAMQEALADAPGGPFPQGLPETLFTFLLDGIIAFQGQHDGYDPKVADRVFHLLWQGLTGQTANR